MQTLVIVSHPIIEDSSTQQFLRESLPAQGVTWHHLEAAYPDGEIDVEQEQHQLLQFDRILFQFPFYWYSSPPLLKHWQDTVLTESYAYGKNGGRIAGKEFGLILSVGVNENEYQAGGEEGFTLSELTKPYQALAAKCGLVYMPIFAISKFDYMNEDRKKELLIAYQQYLTKKNDNSFRTTEDWFKEQMQTVGKAGLSAEDNQLVDHLINVLDENRDHLDDLLWSLEQMIDN